VRVVHGDPAARPMSSWRASTRSRCRTRQRSVPKRVSRYRDRTAASRSTSRRSGSTRTCVRSRPAWAFRKRRSASCSPVSVARSVRARTSRCRSTCAFSRSRPSARCE
jgi:hypothetical protein